MTPAYSLGLRDRCKLLKIATKIFDREKWYSGANRPAIKKQCPQGLRAKAAAAVNVTYGSSWDATAELSNPTARMKIKRISTQDASHNNSWLNPNAHHHNRSYRHHSLCSPLNPQTCHHLKLALKMQLRYTPVTTQCTYPHAQEHRMCSSSSHLQQSTRLDGKCHRLLTLRSTRLDETSHRDQLPRPKGADLHLYETLKVKPIRRRSRIQTRKLMNLTKTQLQCTGKQYWDSATERILCSRCAKTRPRAPFANCLPNF